MSAREFLTNVSFILAVMALGGLLEIAVPFFAAKRDRDRRTANLALTGLGFLVNWLLSSAAAVLALSLRPAGLLSVTAWSPTIRTLRRKRSSCPGRNAAPPTAGTSPNWPTSASAPGGTAPTAR